MAGKVNVGRSGLWRPSVYPFLEQIGEQLAVHDPSEHSVAVDVEGVRILVTPLEQQLVRTMMLGEDATVARTHMLVRDGLGLRVKLLAQLNQLAQVPRQERTALVERINGDVGLGCQLMHEITLEMKAITASGDMAGAKLFSQYRQQLARIVAEAERRVTASGDARFETTENWVPTGYAPRVPQADGSPQAQRRGAPPQAAVRRLRIVAWVVALAALAAVAVYVVLSR